MCEVLKITELRAKKALNKEKQKMTQTRSTPQDVKKQLKMEVTLLSSPSSSC